MNYDFMIINESYVLRYIVAPNKLVYFSDITSDLKLECTDCRYNATVYVNRNEALSDQERIVNLFGLEFQIIKEV